MAWENRRVFLGWENTHMRQISADHHAKEGGPKKELSILQDNLDDQVQKKTKICVRRYTPPFVGITIMSTHMIWIILNQAQEIRSGFGLEFTLMSGFGTMAMCRNSIWDYSLLPNNKY